MNSNIHFFYAADPNAPVDPPSDFTIVEIKSMPQSWLPVGKKLGSVCYRMSRDGDIWKGDPSTFHKNCDNQGPTLSVVKDTKGYVFGGYLSVSWTGSGDDKKDPNAWLFALKNAAKIGQTKLPL